MTTLELLKTGFFLGIGWWLAKIIFIIAVTTFTGKPIEISKEEN